MLVCNYHVPAETAAIATQNFFKIQNATFTFARITQFMISTTIVLYCILKTKQKEQKETKTIAFCRQKPILQRYKLQN